MAINARISRLMKNKKVFQDSERSEMILKKQTRQTCFNEPSLGTWYAPVLIGSSTLGEYASSPACLRRVIDILEQLEPDDYVRYLLAYYSEGLSRFNDHWRYADITTVLFAAAHMIKPQNYLEIGTRRGRSMAMVAAPCPECQIVGFDMWLENYAGIPNPGPEFVRQELDKLGFRGTLELISGDSHNTLASYFTDHPEAYFDLITVDGDHSNPGAAQDIRDVIPRLRVGGVLVFDDITHPSHPGLAKVWQQCVKSNPQFTCWEFEELGYGVALAIRKSFDEK